jgi:arginyl-tRNA synthetase
MKKLIKEKIILVLKSVGVDTPAGFNIDQPPKREMGDFATNVAMVVASLSKKNPREIAETIKAQLEKDADIEKVEIAGPGFINIFVKNDIYFTELQNILDKKSSYGKSNIGKGKKVNIEYISANPTGPLHVGNARSGPIGLALSKLFKFQGYEVIDEFYVNDLGGQIVKFGKALYYWFEIKTNPETEFPEGGYPGGYIKETSEMIQRNFAEEIKAISDRDAKIEFFAQRGLDIMIENIKNDVALVGIEFDKWTKESEILKSGRPEKVVSELKSRGFVAEKDGAVWFKNPDDTELADAESVLIKSDEAKTLTYFTNDISYHLDKFDQVGKDGKLIDVWGANHSGHIPRIKAALSAIGYPAQNLEIVLYQYVRLKKSGVALSMGKRLGNFITLRAVIEAGVQPDAFKYFIISQNNNTPIDFDIELAADTSEKNPVFYIKYAHARIASILKRAEEFGVIKDDQESNLKLLNTEKELTLIKEIIKFPEIISATAENFQIQTLPHFAYNLASLFHDFYNSCKVLSDDEKLTSARLSLILATKYVLANALDVCGIDAPEKM